MAGSGFEMGELRWEACFVALQDGVSEAKPIGGMFGAARSMMGFASLNPSCNMKRINAGTAYYGGCVEFFKRPHA